MPGQKYSRETLQEAINAYAQHNCVSTEAAKALNLPESTYKDRLRAARTLKLHPSEDIEDLSNPKHLAAKLKRVEAALRQAEKSQLDHSMIKSKIIQLTHTVTEIDPPAWMIGPHTGHDFPGVPTLFVSDLHGGEVVDPKQIGGVNKFNTEIFHQRMERLVERTIRLLSILSPKMDYPGIVVPFGGDMITGNIHDELTATNEMNSMPSVLDVFEVLKRLILTLLTKLDRIFIPCVTGNHGRDTRKIWAKDRHHTSFDWLIYCFLAKAFADNDRVTFLIPDGSDAYYKIYDHRYTLTHGDQFRGGDGVIGPLGPIIRGDHRKRSRNAQINLDYDTLIMGHFHQHMQLTRLIVNGSVKGYDEYAYRENFPFEQPQQALWLTHPRYRITYRMPVVLEAPKVHHTPKWVSWSE